MIETLKAEFRSNKTILLAQILFIEHAKALPWLKQTILPVSVTMTETNHLTGIGYHDRNKPSYRYRLPWPKQPILPVSVTMTKTNHLTGIGYHDRNKPSYRYGNEINTVNQVQLNYSTNIHLLIRRFINILCVITIRLNTLTDVPYQLTVGGVFVENLVKRSCWPF